MKTPFAIIILLVCRISAENSQELPNVIAVVGRPFTYSLPSESGVSKHYKVRRVYTVWSALSTCFKNIFLVSTAVTFLNINIILID